MPIEVGYFGYVEVDGVKFRCNSMSSTPTQTVLPYKHVFGLNDTGGGNATKGEAVGSIQPQKSLWRPSMELITGSFTFVADETNLDALFDYIRLGTYISSIKFYYTCGTGVIFTNCRLNQYTFRATAGDTVNISAGFTASEQTDDTGGGSDYTISRKLITWDKIKVDGVAGDIQSVELNVTNEIIPIYSADGTEFSKSEFGLRDMRIGTQNVTGRISTYIKPEEYFIDADSSPQQITISATGGLSLNMSINAILTPIQVSTSTGVFSAGVVFTGVGYALGQ